MTAFNAFNRPWHDYHRPWYHGGWIGWPSYPVFWADLTGGNWLMPWAGGDTFAYSNPYFDEPVYSPDSAIAPALDYSEAIPVPTAEQAADTDEDIVTTGQAYFDRARAAFKKGDYARATAEVDRGLSLLRGDRTMHEFRALTLFARQKYSEAASVLYAVLAAGPGWDWDTMAALYPDTETYTQQLRTLEKYVSTHPKDAKAHFLLGYHYLVLDDRDAAITELRTAAKLMPQDKLSAQLADALSSQPTSANKED